MGHNAHVVLTEPQKLDGIPVEERLRQFRSEIAQATRRWEKIRTHGVRLPSGAFLRRWDEAAEAALSSGLDQRERLAALLRH